MNWKLFSKKIIIGLKRSNEMARLQDWVVFFLGESKRNCIYISKKCSKCNKKNKIHCTKLKSMVWYK